MKIYTRCLILSSMLGVSALLGGCTPATTVSTASGVPVASEFLGLSIEWCNAQTVMGTAESGGTDPIFKQYVANLTAYGAGPMFIRVGGGSTDYGYSCAGATAVQDVTAMKEFAAATGTKFSLGLNLLSDDLRASKAQAAAYCAEMPTGSIAGFEIGNEPDLYTIAGWSPHTYYTELSQYLAGVLLVQSCTSNLMGPSFSQFDGDYRSFLPNVHDILVLGQGNGLDTVTQHYYAGNRDIATPGFLLSAAAYEGPERVLSEIQLAHSFGMAYRVDEMNSASGGGAAGVSNAFESALWFLDNALHFAAEGVDGINIHGGMLMGKNYNYYTPFFIKASGHGSFSLDNSGSFPATAPLYYGMLFFERAINGANSTISPASVSTTANIDAWSTVDGAGTKRLILVSRDTMNSSKVVVANSASTASVCYLTAPSYRSTSGLKIFSNFAGTQYQSFDTSNTGAPTGTVGWDVLTPSDGLFTVPMGITEAAIVTFGVSTGC